MSEWPLVSVEDIKDTTPYALATGPFGSSISSRFFQDYGVPVIRGSNLSEKVDIRLNPEKFVFISEEKAKQFQRSIVRSGDLVFTCWGTIGQVGLIEENSRYPEYVVSNKQMKFTPDPSKADSLFLYYLFSGPEMLEEITNQAIGSSVPGFNLGQLRSITFRLPPLPTQRRIAQILGRLDDKIELNRRINRTLEAMAQALYKHHFVDFDPYQDSEFIDSELGQIPEGWEVGTVEDMIELAYGKGLPQKKRIPGPYPVFGSSGQVGMHNDFLIEAPGIIVGRKGTIGRLSWASSLSERTTKWPPDSQNELILTKNMLQMKLSKPNC